MRTFIPKKEDLLGRKFQIVDATDMILGKMCSKIASVLRGKDKTIVTPGVDCGDKVIVINSDKLILTSNKLDTAIHYKHTGYIGNLKEKTMRYRMEKDSTEVVRTTVKRMLGKGPLARERLRNLFIYKDENHKHKGAPIRDPKDCSMFRLGKELHHRGRDEGFKSSLSSIKIISEIPRSLSVKSILESSKKELLDRKQKNDEMNSDNKQMSQGSKKKTVPLDMKKKENQKELEFKNTNTEEINSNLDINTEIKQNEAEIGTDEASREES